MIQECPDATETAKRRGFEQETGKEILPIAQVLKTYYTPQGGKLSLVRVWQGQLSDGLKLGPARLSGIYKLSGLQQNMQTIVPAGSIVALARLEGVQTGDTLWGAITLLN